MCCYLKFLQDTVLTFLCSLFKEYMALLLCFISLAFTFLFSNKIYYVYLLYVFIYFTCYLLHLFIICDNKYPTEKGIPSGVIIHNIIPIMQNIILICILNNFIELESLELQIYFDICSIHLLNNQL